MAASLPVLSGHISVVNSIKLAFTFESAISALRTFDVLDLHQISDWLGRSGFRMHTFYIFNHHIVTDKLIRLRFNKLK